MAVLDFDRWEHVAMRVVLGATLVVVPVLALAPGLSRWISGAPLERDVAVDAGGAGPAAAEGVTAAWADLAHVVVPDPSVGQRVADLGPALVVAVAAVVVGWCGLGIAAAIRRGDGFADLSVGRLRAVGMTLLLAPWLHVAAETLANRAAANGAFPDDDVVLEVGLTGSVLLVSALGLLIALLAEGFAQGRRLRDDVEGLV